MIALFVIFSLFLTLSSCGDMFVEKDLLQRPQAKRCSDCHKEMFKEWERSRHAIAWRSEKFRLESENYTGQCTDLIRFGLHPIHQGRTSITQSPFLCRLPPRNLQGMAFN